MRKLLAAAVVLLIGASQTQASFQWATDLDTGEKLVPVVGEQIEIKYNNYENRVETIGDQVFGVGYVTSISQGSNTLWQHRTTDGGEITLVFSDYTLRSQYTSPFGAELFFDGGQVTFYYDDTPEIQGSAVLNPIQGTNSDPDSLDGRFSDGVEWLTASATTGVWNSDIPDQNNSFDETNATLKSSLTNFPNFVSGSGEGLFDVTGGMMAEVLDSDTGWHYNPTADLLLSTRLDDMTGEVPAGSYAVRSFDPMFGQYVPEPASALIWAVFGIGMVLGMRRNRK